MRLLAPLLFFLGLALGGLGAYWLAPDPAPDEGVSKANAAAAEQLMDLAFRPEDRELMQNTLESHRSRYQQMRETLIPNPQAPALVFDPRPIGYDYRSDPVEPEWSYPEDFSRPADDAELAWLSLSELGALLRNGEISSVELTEFFLGRLREHGDRLEAVISLTEDRALAQAETADRELAAGIDRGPLHGIPYGAKDLFAVEGTRTTWGAAPFEEQVIDETATVIRKLDESGAVLIAKLTLGALAWGDVWYGGTTRNPWDPELEQGASGSSAGSGAATAAGLVPFALGTETLGSLVSPATRTGTTALRPSFGRVSRHGAMALSWSMDKVGPMTRSVDDAARVFAVIDGPDGKDVSLHPVAFDYQPREGLEGVVIGYLENTFEGASEQDKAVLDDLEALGAELRPVALPNLPLGAMQLILDVEAATAFDAFTRDSQADELVRQEEFAWPNVFRAARFIPAVEYLQANRLRQRLIEEMHEMVAEVDVYVAPSHGNLNLLTTNLSGHPAVTVPNGLDEGERPTSITFTGGLFEDDRLLEVVSAWQVATEHHQARPPNF
ncbi:amidase [Gammaproteobacteria bacterium AB-CW1]|uniref:Amidase n=1 Tax=Natronospira elongata TaxID=3110268 RepID=A0AAP6MM03_9GAMM|nr:amidase [Gammaproteobacteria bacterium AB-CW1]